MVESKKNSSEDNVGLDLAEAMFPRSSIRNRSKFSIIMTIVAIFAFLIGFFVFGVISISSSFDWHNSRNINAVCKLTRNVFIDNKAQIIHDYKEKLIEVAYFHELKKAKPDYSDENVTNIDVNISDDSLRSNLFHYVQDSFTPEPGVVNKAESEYGRIRAKVYLLPDDAFSKISEKLSKIKKSYEDRLKLAQKRVKSRRKVDYNNVFIDETKFSIDDFEPIGRIVNEVRMHNIWVMAALMAADVIIIIALPVLKAKNILQIGNK